MPKPAARPLVLACLFLAACATRSVACGSEECSCRTPDAMIDPASPAAAPLDFSFEFSKFVAHSCSEWWHGCCFDDAALPPLPSSDFYEDRVLAHLAAREAEIAAYEQPSAKAPAPTATSGLPAQRFIDE